ncbi:MAG TPA: sialidase family protein [Candidatus Thermoplasmatota archaeon]|nr:sialidase family protein [Candidatus Thermoplasmatota archaeon]
MRAVPLVLVALLFAGCTTPAANVPFLPPAPTAASMVFDLVSLEHEGGEPTMGIDSEGRAYVISDASIFRSDDQGATWTDVTPSPNNWPVGSLDPYIYVDRDTDRVYADHLYVGCSYLLWSDDHGASWTANPGACGRPGNDHQTVASGVPVGVPTVGYPKVVYYGYNDAAPVGLGVLPNQGATSVARSVNGGVAWEPAVIAIGPDHCGGLNGHIATAPDGTVYVPSAGCDEPVVAVSRDSGSSWEVTPIDTKGHGRSEPGDDPSLAVDDAGNAFLVWPGKDARMYGALSTDAGKTFGAPFAVSPPHVNSSLMPTSVAGAAGRVAFAYYGTSDTVGDWKSVNSDDASKDTRWHVFVTYSLDALSATPTWTTVQVTPDDDPVQVGSIHNGGGGDPDRNLLDFFDMAAGPDGKIMIVFTDGCKTCDSPDTSRDSTTTVATLREGPVLVAS